MAQKEFHRPLASGSEAMYSGSATAHCSNQCGSALKECTKGVPLPTVPHQCGGALKESPGPCPMRLGSQALHKGSSTAQLPHAVTQCTIGVPLPTAP